MTEGVCFKVPWQNAQGFKGVATFWPIPGDSRPLETRVADARHFFSHYGITFSDFEMCWGEQRGEIDVLFDAFKHLEPREGIDE